MGLEVDILGIFNKLCSILLSYADILPFIRKHSYLDNWYHTLLADFYLTDSDDWVNSPGWDRRSKYRTSLDHLCDFSFMESFVLNERYY